MREHDLKRMKELAQKLTICANWADYLYFRLESGEALGSVLGRAAAEVEKRWLGEISK